MFRNSLDGNRDMYLVPPMTVERRSAQRPNSALHLETGRLPDDGGALQVDAGGNPISVWRREGDVFLSLGPNREQRLGAGRQPILAATPRGPILAWMEGKALKVKRQGRRTPPCSTAMLPSKHVALEDGRSVLAWERRRIVVKGLD